jgi:hypothetical protein
VRTTAAVEGKKAFEGYGLQAVHDQSKMSTALAAEGQDFTRNRVVPETVKPDMAVASEKNIAKIERKERKAPGACLGRVGKRPGRRMEGSSGLMS